MTQTPCTHGGCNCMAEVDASRDADVDTAEGGAFCSDFCANASEDEQEGECACGHPACDV